MDTISREVVGYWGVVVATLNQRGLLKDRPRQGGKILPEVDAVLLPDRVVFALDMTRLGGISRERWLDEALWKQWRAALGGRRCFVSDGGGLGICIAREPGDQVKRLPRLVPLDLGNLPEGAYRVTLGQARRGPVVLDLAGKDRAVLIGGTSGGGKTNLMQAVVLQLAAKHGPDEVRVAIVDTKLVDFGPGTVFSRLPHLFAPVAHELEEARELIAAVENEMLRRRALLAAAGVADWRKVAGLGLVVLVVDEAADFCKTPTMGTLIEIARKGRAFGISVVVGTQNPTVKVVDAQVKANLPTAIAFQTVSGVESRVILGKEGAERLKRPGLALTFVGREWQRVQTVRVDVDAVGDVAAPVRPGLTEVEGELVRYAVGELGGDFVTNRLAAAFKGRMSKRAIVTLAQRWEGRGWLAGSASRSVPRRVTDELRGIAGLGRGTIDGERGTNGQGRGTNGWERGTIRGTSEGGVASRGIRGIVAPVLCAVG